MDKDVVKLKKTQMALYPGLAFSDDLQQMCKSFFKNDEINYFSITRTFSDSSFIDLTSNSSWSKMLYTNHDVISIERAISAECLRHGFVIWQLSHLFENTFNTYNICEKLIEFNYHNGITISQFFPAIPNFPSYYENYHFCTGKQGIDAGKYFMEHYDLLLKFILFFKDYLYQNKKANQFFNKRYSIDSGFVFKKNVIEEKLLSHLSEPNSGIEIKKFYLNDKIYFTLQEMRVIKYLIRAYTCKDIAQIFNTSYRTIQTHSENIKRKTGCKSIQTLSQLMHSSTVLMQIMQMND